VTKAHRRDYGTTGGSVITGMRLEADAAARLREAAIALAEGNIVELVRYYVRTGLGYAPDDISRREAAGTGSDSTSNSGVAGLRLEKDASTKLKVRADEHGMARVGLVRHYVRLGLGIRKEVSFQREERFARIAAARRELADSYKDI
jgi:hypothetical protein